MYENIIGQERITDELTEEIRSGRLPQALLFYGPAYSGKLSVALETARVLTCEKGDALWNCNCRACAMQRLLLHPYTLQLGSRYFNQEIAASADVLLSTEKDFARFLFIRAVRKLLRRFEPFLWEGEESKIQKIQPLIHSVEDSLEQFYPERQTTINRSARKLVTGILDDCRKIAAVMVSDNIPVHLIRRATYWAHISAPGERKVVIIERADRMQDNSRNALLKILEEPPRGVHFILTSERRSTILPTILSRVRSYYFPARNEALTKEVLSKIFREETGEYASLDEYFLAWKGISPSQLEHIARRFVTAVLSKNTEGTVDIEGIDVLAETAEVLVSLSDSDAFQYFLSEISALLRKVLRGESSEIPLKNVGAEKLEIWSSLLQEAARDNDQLNMSASLLLENLFYRMKGVV